MAKVNFTILSKVSNKALEKETKRQKALKDFIGKNFSKKGLNIPFKKVMDAFAIRDEKEKITYANSLDLHKDFFLACFRLAKNRFETKSKMGVNLDTVEIPYFFENNGIATLQTRKASEFENLYYVTLDYLEKDTEKQAKKTLDDDENEGNIESTKEGEGEFNATANILNLIAKYKDSIDFDAISKAIDDATATATDKATATA